MKYKYMNSELRSGQSKIRLNIYTVRYQYLAETKAGEIIKNSKKKVRQI